MASRLAATPARNECGGARPADGGQRRCGTDTPHERSSSANRGRRTVRGRLASGRGLVSLAIFARAQAGAVALLTLVFMLTLGLASMMMLWGIGYSAGAYTTLYAATQAAAYAAVSEVSLEGAGAGAQLPFDCGASFDALAAEPVCRDGNAGLAAKLMLGIALRGQFGLSYPGAVRLVDSAGNEIDGVLAFYIPLAPGVARAADPGCSGIVATENARVRSCWRNPGRIFGQAAGDFFVSDPNYLSGIVAITEAEIPFPPSCRSALCPTITLRVAVAARQGQQLPPGRY